MGRGSFLRGCVRDRLTASDTERIAVMLSRIKNRRPHQPKQSPGFTLIELLIVIGVIVVLIALLLPSVASVRSRARTTACPEQPRTVGPGPQSGRPQPQHTGHGSR